MWFGKNGGRTKSRSSRATDLLTESTGIEPYDSQFLRKSKNRAKYVSRGKQAALLDKADRSSRNASQIQEEIRREFDTEAQSIRTRAQYRYKEGAALREKYRQDITGYAKEAEHWKGKSAIPATLLHIRERAVQLIDRLRALSKSLCIELDEATADYSDFVRGHPVGAKANFAENRIIPIAVIVAAVLFETIVNAYFFINATSLGIVGSLFEVVFFAPINVAVAVVFALFSLRYIRHQNLAWRVIAGLSGAIFLLFIIGFNIYLAGVRIYLDGRVSADLVQILKTMLGTQVLQVMDYKAISVLTSGLAMAAIAAIEAYRLFDPYPGYTRIYQRLSDARDALHDIEIEYMEELNALAQESDEQLDDIYEQCIDFAARHRKLLEISRDDRNRELQQHATVDGVYRAAVDAFQVSYAANMPFSNVDLPEISPLTPVTGGVETSIQKEEKLDQELQTMLPQIEVHFQSLTQEIFEYVDQMRSNVSKVIKSVQFELHEKIVQHPSLQSAELAS